MRNRRIKAMVLGLVCGAMPLITTISCDPYRGTFDFFRDRGSPRDYFVYDGFFGYTDYYVYDAYYVDDCWGWCW